MVLLCLFSGTSHAGEILWSLDLANHPEGPASEVGKGLEVYTEDGIKMLRYPEEEKDHYVRFPNNFPSSSETRDWNNLIFQVRFRSENANALALLVKKEGARSDVAYDWYYVSLSKDGIQVRVHGLAKGAAVNSEDPRVLRAIKFKDNGDPPLIKGEWVTVVARIGEEVIQITVTSEDGTIRQSEFATFPGSGGVHLLALNALDVSEITVRAADAPVEPSHPTGKTAP